MKSSIALTLLAAAVVSAQSSGGADTGAIAQLAALPSCAMACTSTALPVAAKAGCDITKPEGVDCLCKNEEFQNTVTKCVMEKCNDSDQCKTAQLSQTSCKGKLKFEPSNIPKGCDVNAGGNSTTSGGNSTSTGTSGNATASGSASGSAASASSTNSGASQFFVSGTAALFGLVAFLAL